MRIARISGGRASAWFSREELTFLIAAIDQEFIVVYPEEFLTLTSFTMEYAHEMQKHLRTVQAEMQSCQTGTSHIAPHTVDHPAGLSLVQAGTTPGDEKVTMRLEHVAQDKALLSLSGREFHFLADAINEAVRGQASDEESLKALGRTRKDSLKFLDRLAEISAELRFGPT